MTNRLAINKAVTVHSVNGPLVTVILGVGTGTGATNNGDGAIRCAYVGTNAMLSGFTLTNGRTRTTGDSTNEQSGGGAWCELSGVISNCTLTGNSSVYGGGGEFGGTLNNCILRSNSVSGATGYGGGAYAGSLNNCTLNGNSAAGNYSSGGGGYSVLLTHCTLSTNWANDYGGGVSFSSLSNCTLNGNSAFYGGGASFATLNNCTLIGNSAAGANGDGGGAYLYEGGGDYSSTLSNCTLVGNSAGFMGGGASYADLQNCIVYYNSAPDGSNDELGTLNYICTMPLPPDGSGNMTNAPLFVNTNGWTNLRLQSNSPCINSGNNGYAPGPTDLDGNPRIRGGTVDMGAYEFQTPTSVLPYAWLQSYGLATDGSADYADPDGDGMNNWQEWVAGTNPTNAASVLKMLSAIPIATNVVITWTTVSNRSYNLARSTNLRSLPVFTVLSSNIGGLSGTTSFTDTNRRAGAAFYRVAVQQP
jgi:hypothetical protein